MKFDQPTDGLFGRTLEGRYTILSPLGKGGMSRVYVGRQHSLDRMVAVKVLLPGAFSEKTAERLRREARAAGQLSHASAAEIYDFGQTDDGIVYIVMELLEGHLLSESITPSTPMPAERITRIMHQICAVVGEAHDRNILHRDLKPRNVFLIDERGIEERVKVLDFGLAWALDNTVSRLTVAGKINGTPAYMSPEVALDKPLGPASDIYSLGIVLYEMLCGSVPFKARSVRAVMSRHVNSPVPPLTEHIPHNEVCESLADLLPQMLAKDPRERFQTMEAVATALGYTAPPPAGDIRDTHEDMDPPTEPDLAVLTTRG